MSTSARGSAGREELSARLHPMSDRLPRLGALVFFTSRLDACVGFYRMAGIPLVEERHDDEELHFACDLDGVHVAFFDATNDGSPAELGTAGCCFPGLAVSSVSEVVGRAESFGATVLQPPTEYPWGLRAVLSDPAGRPVEVFEPSA